MASAARNPGGNVLVHAQDDAYRAAGAEVEQLAALRDGRDHHVAAGARGDALVGPLSMSTVPLFRC